MDGLPILSSRLSDTASGTRLGVLTATLLDGSERDASWAAFRETALSEVVAAQVRVEAAVSASERFFESSGRVFPLRGQFQSVVSKGFPKVPVAVQALLYAELSTGFLMGMQDLDKLSGPPRLDVADAGESFVGMRGDVVCASGELVIRDGQGILASWFQGPDSRTKMTNETSRVIMFVFSPPSVPETDFVEAVDRAASALSRIGRGIDSRVLTT